MKAVLALAAIIPLAALSATPQRSTLYYVATDGNDARSGELREANATGTDGPFATVHRARDAIRQLKRRHGLRAPVPADPRSPASAYRQPVLLPECPGGAGHAGRVVPR